MTHDQRGHSHGWPEDAGGGHDHQQGHHHGPADDGRAFAIGVTLNVTLIAVMAADAIVSLGVVVAGVGIVYTGWLWLDPVTSLVISVVIVAGTWGLLRDSVRLALQAVPEGIEAERVHEYLAGVPGVVQVHDLHIWGMSTTDTALTAHLFMPRGHPGDAVVAGITERLHHQFNICHATIQVETDTSHACALAPDHVV